MCDDDGSISVLSTAPDIEVIYTPSGTEQDTDDDFELVAVDEEDRSWDIASSCSTSLIPSVHDYEFVHGRRYHGYKRGRYPLPNDMLEQQREETMHALMLEVTNGKLFFADVGDYPQKIIDIGTGNGLWAIDVADSYPSASVVGTDLSPIQPTWLPVNVRMFIEDCEDPDWLHGSGYDLVHFRSMAGTVRDLDSLLAKVYPHIKDGGCVEFHEVVPRILCDDGTMEGNDPLATFNKLTQQGLRKFGCATFDADTLRAALENAGFAGVQCVTKKVPASTWGRGRRLRTLGLFMKAVMQDALGALAAKPLAALDIDRDEAKMLVTRAMESLDDDRVHRYVNCVFCYGRKEALVSDSESYV